PAGHRSGAKGEHLLNAARRSEGRGDGRGDPDNNPGQSSTASNRALSESQSRTGVSVLESVWGVAAQGRARNRLGSATAQRRGRGSGRPESGLHHRRPGHTPTMARPPAKGTQNQDVSAQSGAAGDDSQKQRRGT